MIYNLASRSLTHHPDDHYLSVFLRFNPENQTTKFITHIYNSELNCFIEGHYFDNIFEAIEDYKTRR